jgi:hypothetical protein
MTTPEKCDKPATGAIKVGSMGEFAPACDKHIAAHRMLSAKAGKKPLPKGATKAQAAQIVGANLDDEIPVLVRPLSEIEKTNNPICCNHLIDAGA